MSEEHMQESIVPKASNILQNRPQRRQHPGLALLLSLLGAGVVVAIVTLVAWQALSPHSSPTGTGTASNSKGNNNSAAAVPSGWNDPATYWNPIRTTVAQGLHLSIAEVTARLRAATPPDTFTPTASNKSSVPAPGLPMTTVATQQGLSTEQLHTLELSALQNGCNAMVAQGRLSQVDANQRMQMFNGWDQGTLNWYIMHAFTDQ